MIRVYIIGVEPIDASTKRLIEGADLCVVGLYGAKVGTRFDTGDKYGVVEIKEFESTRIALCGSASTEKDEVSDLYDLYYGCTPGSSE